MLLESRLSSGTATYKVKVRELSERLETSRDTAKDNTIKLLAHMCNTSKDIKSGKSPPLDETLLFLYKIAKDHFNPEMLSAENRCLYFKIVQAVNEAYSVIENYYHRIGIYN